LDELPEEAATPLELSDLPEPFVRLPAIPGFEFLEVIGRGGMGVVYRARQVRLKRVVAMKLLLPGVLADAASRVRFQQEAQAVAQMQHPGIVPVYEAGDHEGQPWFAMEYVAGRDLAHLTEPLPFSPTRAARLLRLVCDAVQYAHEQGVLHRDLKPSNILLDADDRPRLTDFGLARRLDADPELTLPGQALGSPGYLAPEQAAANRGESGPASDVYSLGAVLYYLLTGRAPFLASKLADALREVLGRDPVPIRELNPSVPRDLETIALKCLEKRPADRYPSAGALGDDLARFIGNEPIVARPPAPWTRGLRWIRAQPVLAALGVVAALGLMAATATGLWLGQQGRAEAREARASRAVAEADRLAREAELRRSRVELYATRIGSAHSAWRRGDLHQAWEQLNAAQTDEPGWEHRHLHAAFTRGQRILRGHAQNVFSVAFSPDGGRLVSGSSDQTVRLWDPASGDLLKTIEVRLPRVAQVAFGVETNLLWLRGADRGFDGLDLGTAAVRHSIQVGPVSIRGMAPLPDGRRVAIATVNDGVRVWDVVAGSPVAAFPGLAEGISELALDPKGRWFALGGAQGTVAVRDLEAGEPRWQVAAHSNTVWRVVFDAAGDRLLSVGVDGRLRVWGAAEGRELWSVAASPTPLRDGVFCPDGRWIATSALDRAIRLWNADTGEAVGALLGHTEPAVALAFSPDGHRLASAGRDRTVRVWELPAAIEDPRVIVHEGPVEVVAVSAAGRECLSWAADQRLVWRSTPAREPPTVLPRAAVASVTAIAFAPGAKLAVVGTAPGVVELWDLEAFTQRGHWSDHRGAVRWVAWNADGSQFATAGDDAVVQVRETATGNTLARLTGHTGAARQVVFSRDGRRVASVGSEPSVKIWNIGEQRQVQGQPVRRGRVLDLVATDRGFLMATQSAADQRIAIEDPEDQGRAVELPNPGGVRLIAGRLSAEGRRFFGGRDRSLLVWDAHEGVLLLTLNDAVPAPVSALALSGDQQCLVAGDRQGGITVFDAPSHAVQGKPPVSAGTAQRP
jgi:WD40 repeat protein/predicted Ser/Thr protein kinase